MYKHNEELKKDGKYLSTKAEKHRYTLKQPDSRIDLHNPVFHRIFRHFKGGTAHRLDRVLIYKRATEGRRGRRSEEKGKRVRGKNISAMRGKKIKDQQGGKGETSLWSEDSDS